MFSKFKGQIDTIFVDSNSANFEIDKRVNIVLSPSFYWVKKVSLPVKSMREVHSLLESLFEDVLPEGKYSYSAYKKGDFYFIFAYEDKIIIDTLHKKGIAQTQIHNVYLAQSELSNLESPKKIDDENVILVNDDIVVLLPISLVSAEDTLDVSTVTLSKNTIRLKQFGHIVNDKSLYTIAGIFLVLIVIITTQYFITLNKIDKIQMQKNELFSKYGLKPTMIQNRAILAEYEKIYKTQIKFRTTMASILSLHLKPSQKIKLLQFKAHKLTVAFINIKSSDKKSLEQDFSAKKLEYKAKYKDAIWYVEFKL